MRSLGLMAALVLLCYRGHGAWTAEIEQAQQRLIKVGR